MKTTPIPVKFDRQGLSCNFYGGFGPTAASTLLYRILAVQVVRTGVTANDGRRVRGCCPSFLPSSAVIAHMTADHVCKSMLGRSYKTGKLTWLVLGGDPPARSRRVEQFTAL